MADEIPLETADTQANPVSNGTGPTEAVVETPPVQEPTPEPQITEPVPTAQPVEPLNPEPEQVRSGAGPELITEPQPTLEPVPEPSLVPEPNQAPEPASEPSIAPTEPSPVPKSAQPLTPTEPIPESVPESTFEPVPSPESQPAPEPIPVPQVQTSTPPQPSHEATAGEAVIQTSLARQLLVKARETIQFRKRRKLEKIMGLFLKKQSISNDDVEKLLHISDATATRYLNQLEREGRIRRENAGKYLSYSRI